jgi:hypothetical protein
MKRKLGVWCDKALILTHLYSAFITGHTLVVEGGMLATGTEQRAFVTK